MTNPTVMFTADEPTLTEIVQTILDQSHNVFGGRFPIAVYADDTTVKAWMAQRGSPDAEAADAGNLWTHLFAAPILRGHPLSIQWED